MPDKLVKWLNAKGYQAVYLPSTGFSPPDLYTFVKKQKRLVRLGPLVSFIRTGAPIVPNRPGQVPDVELTHTNEKRAKGAGGFLKDALRSLGLGGSPSLDFGLSGEGAFTFKLIGVTTEETDLATVKNCLSQIDVDLLPRDEDLRAGNLHVAYHYAYAAKLEMLSSGKIALQAALQGAASQVVEIEARGKVSSTIGDSLVFKPKKHARVAFAYRAARVLLKDARFELFAEDVRHFTGDGGGGYVPVPGVPVSVAQSS